MPDPILYGHRGGVSGFLWPLTRYVVTHITSLILAFLFFALNRTTVIGRRHVPRRRNTLLMSNHQSMIDSFMVGFAAYFGTATFKPYLIPWNPAAEENFFRNRFWSWWAYQWKCIPVKAGRRDLKALYRMIHSLEGGTMILFPEGTRTRDGTIGRGRPGAGLVILANHPEVIPVTVDGMRDVLPVGSMMPRVFKKVFVVFGKPVDYSEFIGRERSKQTAQQIVDKVIDVLRHQMQGIRRLRAGEITRRELSEWLDRGGL
jgi:1-acyl-sn-glycerol-3-phosphate acyltransferase